MKEAGDLRSGNVYKEGNNLFVIVKAIYNSGGRNAATVKLKVKNLATDSVSESVVRSTEKYDVVVLDKKQMQYLYGSNGFHSFMDQKTYDQIELPDDILGDALNYLKEGSVIDIAFHSERPVSFELPINVDMPITYTEPAVKGDTSGKVMKPAKIETDYELMVPMYCEIGDMIRIDTRTNEFMERVSKK